MKQKHCPRCQTTKPIKEFGAKLGQQQSRCMACIREVNREDSAAYRRMIEIKKREKPKYYGME